MTKKKEIKKDDDGNEALLQQIEVLTNNNGQLQQTANSAISQLQNYMGLCSQYEKTIQLMGGRIEEMKMQVAQVQQQLQQLQQPQG